MSQRLWEGAPYQYNEIEAMLAKIRKQIRWGKFREAAILAMTLYNQFSAIAAQKENPDENKVPDVPAR
jgi:hypothetical protein